MDRQQLLNLLSNDPDVIEAVREIARDTRSSRETVAVRTFKRDVAKWTKEMAAETHTNFTAIQNGLYGVLRTKLKLKSMNGLTDDQVPEARELFNQYKQFMA